MNTSSHPSETDEQFDATPVSAAHALAPLPPTPRKEFRRTSPLQVVLYGLCAALPLALIAGFIAVVHTDPNLIGVQAHAAKVAAGPTPHPTTNITEIPISSDPAVTTRSILDSVGAPSTLQVVYTNDPKVNCGYEQLQELYKNGNSFQKNPDNWSGGCYQTQYKNSLIVYWGANTDFAYRKFELLHEYGHYTQFVNNASVYKKSARADIEKDADCRAYNFGADESIGPGCQIKNWSPNWFKQQKFPAA